MIEQCELQFEELGRLEVGTESAVDRGKSTKSFLMSFFQAEDHHNVEGVDTFNACYGGTNALFNTKSWMQSTSWQGSFGAVVCSDPAVHPDPATLSGIGASSISMLLSPFASMRIGKLRVSFIKHAWDFYRPVGWATNDALVDVSVATQ